MIISDWEEFYRSLSIRPGLGIPMKKPDIASIEAFEATAGFRLPQSYKSFILVFGPGNFTGSLQIAAPGDQFVASSTYSLEGANEAYGYRGAEVQTFPSDQQERLNRLYYFGLENEREWLGWDIEDVHDAALSEYGIYRVGLTTVEFAAPSFRQLIETVCERLFTPDPQWDDEELGPQRVFRPATFQSR